MSHPGLDLTGKVALVTGGNSGIGIGMADALARAGADVCIWGTKQEKNDRALGRLRAHGTRVLALLCDVGDEAAVEGAFATTVKELGKVDSCFANAGIGGASPGGFAEFPTEQWRRVMRVNLDGVFYTLRAATRHLIERGEGGSLVVTSSLSATEGAPRNEAYAAAKGAVISMMKGLAVELARHRIRAHSIQPGWIESDLTEKTFAWPKFAEAVGKRIPMRRWGTGDDFGGLAVYLASDLSAYHTGDNFVIDGGYAIF
jgi:NAD(P)-dependent dehydrogenase (short-subunit alcohol dehydrogenase family)